ncbi:hypothetical protein [Okeania sp. SIO1I7]|uniref:hypothetical protein n=1 Tax=Okeania sp. SIO1I7 TaxID=2607772 RepID=UPI0013FC6902|nr:hypothetical protein [Okeania sp. SIO1I7]NET29523.1 hypothetical protein [Okeania sp. SIO1I7]
MIVSDVNVFDKQKFDLIRQKEALRSQARVIEMSIESIDEEIVDLCQRAANIQHHVSSLKSLIKSDTERVEVCRKLLDDAGNQEKISSRSSGR